MAPVLERAEYDRITEVRVREPEALRLSLKGRARRSLIGPDGNLFIVAADHTARGMLAVGDDPLAVADRYTLLNNIVAALSVDDVDGVVDAEPEQGGSEEGGEQGEVSGEESDETGGHQHTRE